MSANGDETYEKSEEIWDRAAELVALHDDVLEEHEDPEPLPRQYRGVWPLERSQPRAAGINMVEVAPGVHEIQWHIGFADFLTLRCEHIKYPFFFEPDGEHQIKAWMVGEHDPVALGLVRFNEFVSFPLNEDDPPTPALDRENVTIPRGERDLGQYMGQILEHYGSETGAAEWEDACKAREALGRMRDPDPHRHVPAHAAGYFDTVRLGTGAAHVEIVEEIAEAGCGVCEDDEAEPTGH